MKRRIKNGLISCIVFFLSLFVFSSYSFGLVTVTLEWDPNTEPDLEGYRAFSRLEGSTYDYDNPDWEGAETTCTLEDLASHTTYYFVVRAFAGDLESGDSNEVMLEPQNKVPEKPSTPAGPSNGHTGMIYNFETSSSDGDEDPLLYKFDWGDGNISDFGPSIQTHSWPSPGQYCVKAQASDSYGGYSEWSDCHNIQILILILTHTISASAETHGSISPSGSVEVSHGGSQTFTITPAANYHILDVLVDGSSVGAAPGYTFSNVTSDHTILASFTIDKHVITASSGSNGSISPSGSLVVVHGGSQAFAITPAANYHILDVLVDGSSVGAVSSYTFSNVTTNHSIAATFAINIHTITATAGTHGSISPSGSVSVEHGGNVTFSITPDNNYHIADVIVDGNSAGAVPVYGFTNVTASHTIEATFAASTHTITASAGDHGSISPSGSVSVAHGASQSFTITPDTGYHIADVVVDGTSVGVVPVYGFINVTASHTIEATFAASTHTITASAGDHGSISPSGLVSVTHGASQSFTITPDPNYSIEDVLVDGTSVGNVTTYTFTNVTVDHTISATFTGNAHTITASADENGTISPEGEVQVSDGGSITFTITADENCDIDDVLVDEVSVGAVDTYTFSNVIADHTIHATFSCSNKPPVADAGPNQSYEEGVEVTLSGFNSFDPDGEIVSYLWEQIDGPEVELSNPAAAETTFMAPDISQNGAALTFRLTVVDDGGLDATDSCIINVIWVNVPPVALAGPDQTVLEGDVVTLDGSGSEDEDDGLATYEWEQISGPSVDLNSTGEILTFTAPDVGPEGASLLFELTVTDVGGLKSTDSCIVNVTWVNIPPVAVSGDDQNAKVGALVVLDGSESSDPDDGIASYRWSQTAGTPVKLSNPGSVRTTFIAPASNNYLNYLKFQLTVTDHGGLESQDSCKIIIVSSQIVPVSPDIKINGSDEPITIRTGKKVVLSIELDPGDHEKLYSDWWIFMDSSLYDRWFYVNPYFNGNGVILNKSSDNSFPFVEEENSGKRRIRPPRNRRWTQSPLPFVQKEIIQLERTLIYKFPWLWPGEYTFYFAVDNNADGKLNGTWIDSATVKVTW